MNESSNNQADDRSGIGETIKTALRQPSILRVMLGLAATVVVLVGMRLAAPILNPILFALVLALLFGLFPFLFILVVLLGALGFPDFFDRAMDQASAQSSRYVPHQLEPVV